MTREEQIRGALNLYAPSSWDNKGDIEKMTVYEKIAAQTGFTKGAEWSDTNPKQGLVNLSQVWHDVSEEPKLQAWFIAQIGENAFDTFIMEIDKNDSWAKWCRGLNIIRWAYIEDLLPKGGE